MSEKLSIADLLRAGFEATKKNSKTVVPLFAVLQAAVFLITYLLNMPALNILMIPILLLMQIAIFKSYKHPLTKFEFTEVLGTKDPNVQNKLWKLFITYVIYIVLIVLLFLLLIIPGIIFMVYWYFMPYVVLDQGLTGMAALKKSKEIVTGHWWKTFALFIIAAVISAVVSSIISSITSGDAFIGGFLMALISGVISIYFAYVAVAYYYSLKK